MVKCDWSHENWFNFKRNQKLYLRSLDLHRGCQYYWYTPHIVIDITKFNHNWQCRKILKRRIDHNKFITNSTYGWIGITTCQDWILESLRMQRAHSNNKNEPLKGVHVSECAIQTWGQGMTTCSPAGFGHCIRNRASFFQLRSFVLQVYVLISDYTSCLRFRCENLKVPTWNY